MKDEEKNEHLDGDAGVNRLFQQIYAGVCTCACWRDFPTYPAFSMQTALLRQCT